MKRLQILKHLMRPPALLLCGLPTRLLASRLLAALLLVTLALASAPTNAATPVDNVAHAVYEGMTSDQLDKELSTVLTRGRQLKDLRRLQSIGSSIAQSGRCRQAQNVSKQTHTQLLELNQRYQGKADAGYQREANQLRRSNSTAMQQYRACFTEQLRKNHQWPQRGIVDYDSFRKLFTELAVDVAGESDASLKRKADALYAAKQRAGQVSKFPIATLVAASGQVQLLREGRQIRVASGINILAADEIRVGRSGNIHIEVEEIVGSTRRGPFLIALGANSKIRIERGANMVVQDHRSESVRFPLTLLFGTVRVMNMGAGFKSDYSVIAGPVTAQVGGADTVLYYSPKRALVNAKIGSGSVQLRASGGQAVNVQAGQQLTIRRGLAQKATKLRSDQWRAAIVATGDVRNKARAPITRGPQSQPARPGHPGAGNRPASRQDIAMRAAAREAVERMLVALRELDANALLNATSGQAQQNVRRSMSRATLEQVLAQSGRPRNWVTDCVACQPDGACAVPTTVTISGGPAPQYEAMHIVRPNSAKDRYLVDRIDPWNSSSRRSFEGANPLCAAQLR